MKESRTRSVAKSFTWRILATLTTVVIVYVVTGDVAITIEIGLIEFIVKMIIYYIHERLWLRVISNYGQKLKTTILKATTWRLTASATLFVISYIALGPNHENMYNLALVITAAEFVSKITIYVLHERIWAAIPPGTVRRTVDLWCNKGQGVP